MGAADVSVSRKTGWCGDSASISANGESGLTSKNGRTTGTRLRYACRIGAACAAPTSSISSRSERPARVSLHFAGRASGADRAEVTVGSDEPAFAVLDQDHRARVAVPGLAAADGQGGRCDSPPARPALAGPSRRSRAVAPGRSGRSWPCSCSAGAHAVVARVVLELREPEVLHHRRHIVSEPPPQALLEAVPAPDRVLRRASPRLDGALRRAFCSSALPSAIQSPCSASILCRSSRQRSW
jgi:hypothetical protein